mgnify:CR=1 FL=1
MLAARRLDRQLFELAKGAVLQLKGELADQGSRVGKHHVAVSISDRHIGDRRADMADQWQT